MSEPITSYIARYAEDPKGLARALKYPVLLYEPAEEEDTERSISQRRFRTLSGVGSPEARAGIPVVLRVRKEKDNAFRRGVTLGRTSNNDIIIDDASVSRFHAWFQADEAGRWTVADASSKNGTRVSGTRLKPKRPAPLAPDVRLRFGKVEVTFLAPEAFLKLLAARASR